MRLTDLSALIFDLDGTLVISEPAWEAAKREVLGRYGITPSQAFLDDYVGRGLRGFLSAAFGAELTDADRSRIGAEIGAVADRLLPVMRQPIPGAAEFLHDCHAAGLRIALCSSSPRRHILAALAQLGVTDLAEVIVSGAELPRGKPDPLPYLESLAALGLPPAQAAAVEDAAPGFQSAREAGLPVIGIGPVALLPAHRAQLALAVPDYAALRPHLSQTG
jgi:sugar-phosphatase